MGKDTEKKYWANYYKTGVAPEQPSEFARYVLEKYISRGESMVEYGCGNGRDARFFAQNGIKVTAIDLCEPEILALSKANNVNGLNYRFDDFTNLEDIGSKEHLDVVYSRFTLHSVNADGQHRAIRWAYRNLKKGGRLLIETRGKKNEIYGKGEAVPNEPGAFIFEDHYRRFVELDNFVEDIKDEGFAVLEAEEATGFAPFDGTDYHFIRIVATKPS